MALTFTNAYPLAGLGLLCHGPASAVANVTVGLLTLAVLKFHPLVELVTAAFALAIPEVVPSRTSAAARAAESQNAWVSFLEMKMWPRSTARPSAPMRAIAAAAIVTSTKPRSRLRRRLATAIDF